MGRVSEKKKKPAVGKIYQYQTNRTGERVENHGHGHRPKTKRRHRDSLPTLWLQSNASNRNEAQAKSQYAVPSMQIMREDGENQGGNRTGDRQLKVLAPSSLL